MNAGYDTTAHLVGILAALPSVDCDEGWIVPLLPQGSCWRPGSARAHHLFSACLNRHFDLTGIKGEVAQLDETCTTISALSVTQLMRLVKHIGATVHGEEVRRAIAKTEVIAYRNHLGEALYKFVMERAPLLWRSRETNIPTNPSTLPQRILATGRAAMQMTFGDSKQNLCRRILLRLPPEPELDPIQGKRPQPVTEAMNAADIRRLVLRLQRELDLSPNTATPNTDEGKTIC